MKKSVLFAILVFVSFIGWFIILDDDAESGKQETTQQEESASRDAMEKKTVSHKKDHPSVEQEAEASANASVSDADDEVSAVLDLVNELREKKGRSPLSLDPALCEAAQVRAKELAELFSHTRPDDSEFISVLEDKGIDYKTVGENIAQGQETPDEVFDSWRNSSGHYQNMINKDFGKIGIGYDPQSNSWVQLFKD